MNAMVDSVTAATTMSTASSRTALRRAGFPFELAFARIFIVLMNSFRCWKFPSLSGRMEPTTAWNPG